MKFDFAVFEEKGGALLNLLKKHWLIIAALVLGLALLGLSGNEREEPSAVQTQRVPAFSLEAEEKRIANALENIAGVGEVSVVLTLKSSVEQRVARDEATEYRTLSEGYELSSESSAVLYKGGDGEEPIVLKYLYPEYKGALIVADNASASLRLELTNAVAALTGLSTDKISVVPGEI